ncbi:hypothetical protein [Streptomyces sp. NBC_00989]|uniref:hypothetical protein n=1 Tax=Streptomyces sp. NBC_00989 TaxID=2903705 RepID=UPI002F91B8C6|nr:hypothetical protein OG714_54365 [Streptomyces sp. NBC_00989]
MSNNLDQPSTTSHLPYFSTHIAVIRWDEPLVSRLPEGMRDGGALAVAVDTGIRLVGTRDVHPDDATSGMRPRELATTVAAMGEVLRDPSPDHADLVAARVLVLPCSDRWREAVETALLGSWSDPLWKTGHLPTTALGALKAEARTLHRQLVPVWRHGTRAGRVLSLDADLGGLSLYDLVAADVDLLAHTAGGVFEDERLNRVLRHLTGAEQQVVFAYASREGTTWTEAAAHTGAAGPEAFGERVRRKVNRLAAEQRRRAAQRRPGSPTL